MILDTSGLLCFFDARDFRHSEARDLVGAAQTLITHNYVLAEFVPLCQTRRLNRRETLSFVTNLLNNPLFEIAWVDEALHRAAHALLNARLDKTYSLCDAV